MTFLVRFRINDHGVGPGPSYEDVAKKLADYGRGSGGEAPEFTVWGNGQYPESTVIEYRRGNNFATALDGVRKAIAACGVDSYCTGGDLHILEDAF